MTPAAPLCLGLLAVPALAVAVDGLPSSGGMSLFVSFLQMGLALLVVVGLILLVYYGTTRLVKAVPAFGQSGRQIRVVESRPLGPRKALILVEVGGEYLLLASTETHVTLLKQINMLEEIEVLDEQAGRGSFLAFLNKSTARTT